MRDGVAPGAAWLLDDGHPVFSGAVGTWDLDATTVHTLPRLLSERSGLAERTLGEWLRHLET